MELMIKSRNSSSNSLVALDEEESKVEVGKKRSSKAASDDIDNEGDQSEQQVHIWTERERRKRMRSMFTNLHTLLPHLPSKGGGSCSQFPESLSVEDTFKLAAGELNLWLLSF
ncbi:Transcription factor bHLH95 [Linum perenne]